MKKGYFITAAILGVAALILSGSVGMAAETIKIRTVTFLPINNKAVIAYGLVAEKIKKQSKGALVFEFVGGPDVIPRAEQPAAVMKGVVDMIVCPADVNESLIPEIIALSVSQVTPAEERASGFYDIMVDLHKKINIYHLGRANNFPFYVYTNHKVSRPQELARQKMRTTAAYNEFFKALGIVGVSMPFPDIYTGLEQHIIDGFGWSGGGGFNHFGWPEVVKYMIFHPVLRSSTTFQMNLDTWNRIPKHLQDMLLDIVAEVEAQEIDMYAEFDADEQKKMRASGMEFIEFSQKDAQWYTDLAYETKWAKLKPQTSPEMYSRLRQMLRSTP